MDLEKLVALGEKMGLSGAELRKCVSQKEKEEREKAKQEREMKERQLKAELEKERLAAETAKEEREAQERQMQAEMAEREKQRQHEIELERLHLQQRIEAPDQARVESSERKGEAVALCLEGGAIGREHSKEITTDRDCRSARDAPFIVKRFFDR
ncbi:hypothetical protein MTO96_031229 [Rhipicephalus appendiculatus]